MSAQLRRSFDVLFALQGHVVNGLSNKQVAGLVRQTESTTIRDLQTLEELGYVERTPGNEKHWRLTPRLCQIALAMQHEFAREQRRLEDTVNRYTRTSTKD